MEYYLARTSHGSTLSSVVHAAVLARINPDRAWPLFRAALSADLADIQGGTTCEGIHLGAMAGTVDILERSYAGVDRLSDEIRVDPHLPEQIRSLGFWENFRDRWFRFSFSQELFRAALAPDGLGPATIVVRDKKYSVAPGATLEVVV